MMNCQQLKELVIKPALLDLVMFSDVAMELLVFTCATESQGGSFLKQVSGPALGIYQMEPETYNDIWQNYLKFQPGIMMRLQQSFECNRMPSEDRLIYDLRFATAMARIKYERVKEPLPPAISDASLWNYYKANYNTADGAAEMSESINAYHRFIA